jgi:hypothetical protein
MAVELDTLEPLALKPRQPIKARQRGRPTLPVLVPRPDVAPNFWALLEQQEPNEKLPMLQAFSTLIRHLNRKEEPVPISVLTPHVRVYLINWQVMMQPLIDDGLIETVMGQGKGNRVLPMYQSTTKASLVEPYEPEEVAEAFLLT